MSVSPISSLSIYAYLPTFNSSDTELANALRLLMQDYNVTPTGDNELDLQRLKQAMLERQIEQKEQQEQTQSTQNRPWLEIMWELGLHQNESVQEDYDDITEELEYRIKNAQDEEEYNKYINMYNTIEEYFNEYSQGSGTSYSNSYDFTLLGLNQLGLMNMMGVNFS